jgi:hypothetical protein
MRKVTLAYDAQFQLGRLQTYLRATLGQLNVVEKGHLAAFITPNPSKKNLHMNDHEWVSKN